MTYKRPEAAAIVHKSTSQGSPHRVNGPRSYFHFCLIKSAIVTTKNDEIGSYNQLFILFLLILIREDQLF